MRRPNILLLYTDQQRWDAVGVNGNPDIRTPRLDQLASEGVNFDHYFVQNPVCMPSRISFLSGQFCSQLGIPHMGVSVPEQIMTLPKYVKPYGYRTANIGKLHFLPHANREHRDPHPTYGFDHLENADEPGCYEHAYRAWARRKDPGCLDQLSVGLPPAAAVWYKTMGYQDPVKHLAVIQDEKGGRFDFQGAVPFGAADDLTHSAFVGEQTIEFIRTFGQQPFMCIAGFFAPHAPWVVPQRFLDEYDPSTFTLPEYPKELEAKRGPGHFDDDHLRSAKLGYYGMVTEVDHWVGRILDTLDEQGLAEDTIVIFTSDHGEFLGDYLRFAKGYPGPDCVARVPLIVRWPTGIKQPGRMVTQIVEAVDVLPTLLELCGIPVPPVLQGQNLTPLLEGSEMVTRGSALMEHRGWKNLRTQRYRYLLHEDGREMLWDLETDPGEYHDVGGRPEYASVLAEHRHLLLGRLMAMERPLVRSWPY